MPSRARILVVDGHALNRAALQETLEVDRHVVVHAASGEHALARLRTDKIDLVVLDVTLPDLDGTELCRRIRQELHEWTLPIVVLTAVDDAACRADMKEAGADDFLRKPVHRKELLARVRNLLTLRGYYDLSEQLRLQAEEEARRWRIISGVAASVASCRTYHELAHALARLLAGEIPIDAVAYIESSNDGARLKASSRSDDAWEPACRRLTDVVAQPSAFSIATADLATEIIALPITSPGSPSHVCVRCRSPVSPADRKLLADLATHLSNAVANVRGHVQAAQLDDARRRLGRLLAHDFRNPLQILRCSLEVLGEVVRDGDTTEAFVDARAAVDQLQRLVLDLLDVCRADDGGLPFEPTTVDVRAMIRSAVESIAPTIARKRARFELDVDADLQVSLDRSLMCRVIEHIVSNGARRVPDGGSITVRATVRGDAFQLAITNDGPPIPPEVREQLLERDGVGLQFCRVAVERHGGTICVCEPPGGGVEFTITLPLSRANRRARPMLTKPVVDQRHEMA